MKSNKLDTLMVSPANPKMKVYKSIWEEKNDDEDKVICDVCLWEFDEKDDLLVICEGCNSAVHQSCYGGNLVGLKPDKL